MKKGIDVAKWNVIKDYEAVKKAGVEFAIVKVINAKNESDSLFNTHMDGFSKAGIPVIGGYTYTYANSLSKANSAADAFVTRALRRNITFMWLDIEDNCMKNLGSFLVDIIYTYKNIAAQAGMGFGIYTGVSFYNTYIKKYAYRLNGIPFWFARYPYVKEYAITDKEPDCKFLPSGIDVDGWQYSSNGKIPGIVGKVDLDVWFETEPFVNKYVEIMDLQNPFTEPNRIVTLGTTGNDANWVLWYLWRFGKLVDINGCADVTRIDGVIDYDDYMVIKECQKILNLNVDGKVGILTRTEFNKVWEAALTSTQKTN